MGRGRPARFEVSSHDAYRNGRLMSLTSPSPAVDPLSVLSRFRTGLHDCLYARADALFDLADAVLCADGPVTSLPELTLLAEHPRGHGAMYGALSNGWLEPTRLRRLLAAADGRIVLAVDVSNWLRPDAPTSPDLLFCHVYGRGRSADQMIPGWPYSIVAALETGRTSWTAVLDAIRGWVRPTTPSPSPPLSSVKSYRVSCGPATGSRGTPTS